MHWGQQKICVTGSQEIVGDDGSDRVVVTVTPIVAFPELATMLAEPSESAGLVIVAGRHTKHGVAMERDGFDLSSTESCSSERSSNAVTIAVLDRLVRCQSSHRQFDKR